MLTFIPLPRVRIDRWRRARRSAAKTRAAMRKQPQAAVMNAAELLQRAAAAMLLPALADF